MPSITSGSIAEAIQTTQLLEPGRCEELVRLLVPRFPDPQSLADELVRRDWLTRFQVQQLAAGNGPKLVFDHYVILDLIGEGGMGRVYKARQRRLKRLAALKVIRSDCVRSGYALHRFQREAEIVARLDHPNMVRVYDAGEAHGTPYLAMEYLEGADLARQVRQRGPLAAVQACEYVRQAAHGLHHAHQLGLVHRDVKPHNLFLTTQNIVKVLDLGLAHQEPKAQEGATAAGLTVRGAVLGTPDFLAPEQALDASSVDARADVYGLGCTLYFLLTGQSPFAAGTTNEKLIKHMTHEPTPVGQLRADLPPGLPEVLRRFMAKLPNDRYPSAAAAAEALGPFVLIESEKVMEPAPPIATPATPTVSGSTATTPVPEALPIEAPSDPTAPFIALSASRLSAAAKPDRRPRFLLVGGGLSFVVVLAVGAFFALRWSKDQAVQDARPTGPRNVAPAPTKPATRIDNPPPTPEQLRESEQLNLQGLALVNRQEYGRSLELLNRALRLNPKNSAAWNNRGLAYLKMGDFAQAIEDCTKAIEHKADNGSAFFNRGLAYFNQQKFEKAVEDYDRSIDLEPNNDSAWNNRGAAYFSMGKWDKALENLNRAVRINSSNPDSFNNRGAVYANLREYDKALADYKDALQLDGKNPRIYLNRGDLFFRKEEYAKAIEDLDKAIVLDPKFAVAYALRGKAHEKLNHKREAEDDFREALRLDPRLEKSPK